MSEEKELRISKINDGIVIDHINPGTALDVLAVLKINGKEDLTVSVLMNVASKLKLSKDIIKVEKRKLAKKELDRISLISPNATINVVENYGIKDKFTVKLPKEVKGIIKCKNENCVTNTKEPVESYFKLEKEMGKEKYRCHYCERTMEMNEIRESLVR